MKTLAIVQARMGSTRFPDKVMRRLDGVPLIELLLGRLSATREVDAIVLATSVDPRNDPLVLHVQGLGYGVYRGSEQDVLDRFYQAAHRNGADIVVRITGDCPLVDATLVDVIIRAFKDGDVDYACNTEPPTYPDGLDTEVFTFAALQRAWRDA